MQPSVEQGIAVEMACLSSRRGGKEIATDLIDDVSFSSTSSITDIL